MKHTLRSKKSNFLSSFFSFARVDLRVKGVYTNSKYTIRPKKENSYGQEIFYSFYSRVHAYDCVLGSDGASRFKRGR